MTATTDASDGTDPTESTESTGPTEPSDPHPADDGTGLLLVDDAVVVYDRENPFAWIESDASVALAERR
jgi:hypothetical protein